MKNFLLLSIVVLAFVAATTRADLLDCTEEKFIALPDIPGTGPKIDGGTDDSQEEHEIREFFKSIGCQIKKGATKVKEQAKKLGKELKEGFKKWSEKTKDFGTELKTKYNDFKDKIHTDTDDSNEYKMPHRFLESVEIINPDILRAEQQCGHGHILDALGNCSKLRK